MNAAIIAFSPSGNTDAVANLLKNKLEDRNVRVRYYNPAGDSGYFLSGNKPGYVMERIGAHDVLLAGAPVYAHHLQYHMNDFLAMLPKPDSFWGRLAVPFVTYGGVSSGIALEEASVALEKSGRTVLCGMKTSMVHHALKAFINVDFNKPDAGEIDTAAARLADIVAMSGDNVKTRGYLMKYRSRAEYLVDMIVFNERKWHERRYPRITIDEKICLACGRCAEICPVGHIKRSGSALKTNDSNQCIHCTSCIPKCPAGAISPQGDLTKMSNFVQKLIAKGAEKPATSVFY